MPPWATVSVASGAASSSLRNCSSACSASASAAISRVRIRSALRPTSASSAGPAAGTGVAVAARGHPVRGLAQGHERPDQPAAHHQDAADRDHGRHHAHAGQRGQQQALLADQPPRHPGLLPGDLRLQRGDPGPASQGVGAGGRGVSLQSLGAGEITPRRRRQLRARDPGPPGADGGFGVAQPPGKGGVTVDAGGHPRGLLVHVADGVPEGPQVRGPAPGDVVTQERLLRGVPAEHGVRRPRRGHQPGRQLALRFPGPRRRHQRHRQRRRRDHQRQRGGHSCPSSQAETPSPPHAPCPRPTQTPHVNTLRIDTIT